MENATPRTERHVYESIRGVVRERIVPVIFCEQLERELHEANGRILALVGERDSLRAENERLAGELTNEKTAAMEAVARLKVQVDECYKNQVPSLSNAHLAKLVEEARSERDTLRRLVEEARRGVSHWCDMHTVALARVKGLETVIKVKTNTIERMGGEMNELRAHVAVLRGALEKIANNKTSCCHDVGGKPLSSEVAYTALNTHPSTALDAVKAAREVLLRLEWSYEDNDDINDHCPSCRQSVHYGHHVTCKLKHALAKLENVLGKESH